MISEICIIATADGTTIEYAATTANDWHALKVVSQVGWVSGLYSSVE